MLWKGQLQNFLKVRSVACFIFSIFFFVVIWIVWYSVAGLGTIWHASFFILLITFKCINIYAKYAHIYTLMDIEWCKATKRHTNRKQYFVVLLIHIIPFYNLWIVFIRTFAHSTNESNFVCTLSFGIKRVIFISGYDVIFFSVYSQLQLPWTILHTFLFRFGTFIFAFSPWLSSSFLSF